MGGVNFFEQIDKGSKHKKKEIFGPGKGLGEPRGRSVNFLDKKSKSERKKKLVGRGGGGRRKL